MHNRAIIAKYSENHKNTSACKDNYSHHSLGGESFDTSTRDEEALWQTCQLTSLAAFTLSLSLLWHNGRVKFKSQTCFKTL